MNTYNYQHTEKRLVTPLQNEPKLLSYKIVEDDELHGIDLDLAKNYIRADGTYEDVLIKMLLAAAVHEVEKRLDVSLTGKKIVACFNNVNYFYTTEEHLIKEFLPLQPLQEIQEILRQRDGLVYVYYTTQKAKSAEFTKEVLAELARLYENRTEPKKKKLYV